MHKRDEEPKTAGFNMNMDMLSKFTVPAAAKFR